MTDSPEPTAPDVPTDADGPPAAATETEASTTPDPRSVGIVDTKSVRLFDAERPLQMIGGQTLAPVDVAYETYGTLNAARDNAIFICHALTGDAHAAGRNALDDRKPGWWDAFVGPRKGLDTDRYFVICANVLGGCKGTTGPLTPAGTGEPLGLEFPFLTIGDMVNVHAALVEHLGIDKLLAVIGGSLGGMQVLDWSVRHPDQMHAAIVLASAANLSAQGIAFNAIGRRAIAVDPHYNNGRYHGGEVPRYGLGLARMIAHITYLSEDSIEMKFGRRLQDADELAYDVLRDTEFQIESYLHYQGKRFVERFDANSYIYLTRAMDYFDLAEEHGGMRAALAKSRAKFLIASYDTDWLFPTSQSREIVSALLSSGRHVSFIEFDSPYGHDSFLIEHEQLAELVVPFLTSMQSDVRRQTSATPKGTS